MSLSAPGGPPTPGRPSIPRPRLLDLVQRRFGLRVVAVVAGPGFGKSTLLAQALAENRLAAHGRDAWVEATPDHAATSVLISDLLAALGVPPPLDLPTDPDEGARVVADAVWQQAPEQVALVVDDAHTLPTGSPGLAVLTRLVEQLPANGHLLLGSRPPLPVPLTRLMVRGTAARLDEDALAFSDAELGDFAGARGIDKARLDGLSGWPALAELVASTGPEHVGDYLWEEVLHRLAPERRQALAILAAVGSADDGLLAELLAQPVDLPRLLGDLPLVRVSDGWWSVHPLWQTALVSDASTDPLVRAAVEAAPAALRRRGLPRQAMRLLIDREAWAEVDALVVEVCGGISPAVPVDVLSGWLARLPPEVRASSTGMLLEATVSKGVDPATARTRLRAASSAYAARGDIAGELACQLGLFHIAFSRNEVGEMLPLITRWQELTESGDVAAETLAALGRALLAADPTTVRSELERLPAQPPASTTVLHEWVRANLLLLTVGDAELAALRATQALPIAPSTLRSSVRCELVESLRLLGHSDEAVAEVPALLADQPAASVHSPRPAVIAVVLHAFRGEIDTARGLLDVVADVVDGSPLPWAPLAEGIARAAVAVAGGDETAALAATQTLAANRMALPLVLLRVSPAALPLQYVLDPGSRAAWDDLDLLGVLDRLRRLSAAVVAVRESGTPEAIADLTDAEVSSAAGLLPAPWVALLAAALAARSPDDASRLVQHLGPGARPALRALEDTGGPLAKEARLLLSLVPSTPRHSLEICVLGPLTVVRDGVEVDDTNSRRGRVRQLLGYLVDRRIATRHELTAALWPDLEESDGARNLRVTLNYLQKLLEPDRDERDAPFFLRARGTRLELADDPALRVDLHDFLDALDEAGRAEASGSPSLALAAYDRAIETHGGELLADQPAEGWLEHARDRMRRLHLRAVLRAGQLRLAAGEPGRADDLAGRALAIEPWSEEAYRIRVGALLARGDAAGAQRELDRVFDLLDELGVAASPATFELARVVQGR